MQWINLRGQEFAVDYGLVLYFFLFWPFVLGATFYVYFIKEMGQMGFALSILFFLIQAIFVYRYNQHIDQTKHWEKIKATVAQVQIIARYCYPWRQLPFYPKISYSYIIDEKEHYSNRLFWRKCSYYGSEDEATALAKNLIDGNKVTCYVNPKNHDESILIPDVPKQSYVFAALITFFPTVIYLGVMN